MRDILFTVRGERLIPSSASLGKVGDVSAVECVLDVSEWLERWPDAVISVVMVTPDKKPYILAAAVTPTMGKVSFELENILRQSGGYYISETSRKIKAIHRDGLTRLSRKFPARQKTQIGRKARGSSRNRRRKTPQTQRKKPKQAKSVPRKASKTRSTPQSWRSRRQRARVFSMLKVVKMENCI